MDANVIAYLYLPGDHTRHAEALLGHDPEWAAPLLWQSEFRSILAGYMRRGSLAFRDACALQVEAQSLLAGAEYEVDSQRVLELVRDSDCSACDCEFVALATHLDTSLVTMDAKLLRAFPKRAIPLAANRG